MGGEKICYCFNYTEKDIRNDFYEHGRSTIMDRIINEKKDGNCSCESTNPKGR
ncbi:MAG: BFD-like (2Fe-2S) protein [Deltaproteobacteria bacterium]|nr:MAG: BFD-like (2Fe-2S) protein [Deltaproteobacteria bacterium]